MAELRRNVLSIAGPDRGRAPLGLAVTLLSVLLAACGSGSANQSITPATPSVPASSSALPSAASPSAAATPSAVAPSASSASETGPGGIVVIGHSGATGYNSNLSHPGEDFKANSWATGSNPDVDSIYLRSLATDPTVEGKA